MNDSKIRDVIVSFADEHLQPYKLRSKQVGGDEISPKLCPFCNGGPHGDEYSFALSIDKGLFVCKRGSCGRRGRFEELAEHFGQQISYQMDRPTMSKKAETTYKLPDTVHHEPTEEIYHYFETRKISRSTVNAYGIKADDSGNIIFPFYVNGENVFEKFRKPRKPAPGERKEWRYAGSKPVLFGMDLCSFSKPLIICEGQIDAMSLHQAGIMNAVSVPSGCDDLTWIETCFDWLEKFKTIILFGDNDEPGKRMVQTVVRRLDESRCRIVEDYPDNPSGKPCKDANEILYHLGEFALLEMVENAKDVPVKGILDLAEVIPYDPTTVPRIKTMIPALDETIGGLVEGGITVFTGKPGEGKTTITGLLLLNAIEQGHSVCAYSGELRKERFQSWINMQCAGSDYIGLKNDAVKGKQVPFLSYQVQQRIMDWYKGKFFLFDNNEIFDKNQAESIIEVFTMAVRRHGCKLFLVDNLMTALADTEEETKAQGRFANALKNFANRYGVHIIIVAHPRKTKAGESIRGDDIGGNSATIRLADNAVVVEKPNLRVIKSREEGREQMIECCYCPDSRRIYQASVGDMNRFSWNTDGLRKLSGNERADYLPDYQVRLGDRMPF